MMPMSGPIEALGTPLSFRGSAPLLRRPAVRRRVHTPARARTGRLRRGPHAPVLAERLFRDALLREQKRADRFEQPFLLLRVVLNGRRADLLDLSADVVAALRAIGRETDLIGWFKTGRVLGLIVPEIRTSANGRREICRRFAREIALRLDPAILPMLHISVRLHTGSSAMRPQGGFHSDASLGTPAQRAGAILRDAAKRALDVAGSFALLAVASPVFLIVAAAVKLTSPGPILFRQERVGHGGERFTMLKFRTMYAGADKAIHQQYVTQFIKANSAASGTGSEALFKIVNDPRVTPVGNVLRKTSLDELPQFWNVLRGEMSLVGPRPPLPYEVEQYRRWHHRRVLDVKPGITGLWQVLGRSRTTFDEMVRLDLRYARTRSFWTDIRILLATPRAVISGKGAC